MSGWSKLAALAVLLAVPAPASAAPALNIDVISNRADLISAGDALVAVDVPAGVDPATVQVTDDGRDVTGAFATRPNGRFGGLVTGLEPGPNELRATAAGADPASITVVDHPNGGPVFSGPQIQPWVCTNGSSDPQCNAPATYRYEYKSSLDGLMHDYDPDNPPPDVATTTTQTGVVGVQWGLEALKKSQITPAQFVDLNEKTGGLTVDAQWQPQRTEADATTLQRAYRSGAINSANHLDKVAIIDFRGPDHGVFHDAYRSWAVRARLEREHGHHENHVIWMGHVPLIGDPRFPTEALLTMDAWLAAVEADDSTRPLAEKIVANRPPDLHDRCSQTPAVEQIGPVCEQEHVQSRYGTPATVAGEGIATDTNKCALKPLRRADYYPIVFTAAQWARLERAFPTGVCDWSRPGVEQQGAIPWQTYQEADGTVIYGGRGLGPAPGGSGWTSAAWRD